MKKITLNKEKETLLIPLYGKAMESQKPSPILVDEKAVEVVKEIDYDFMSLKIPEKTNMMMSLRAKMIDNYVKDFIEKDSESVALHLGCGLDSRYNRINNLNVDWYDVDFEEVIDIRKVFYPETEKYHLIPSSVTEYEWLEKIPQGKKQYIVVAEGLFMYLKEDEIRELIKNLKNRLGSYTLIFDAFSAYTAEQVNSHPSLEKTGALIQWGIDDPKDLTKWEPGIKFIKEQYFTSSNATKNLGFGVRIAFAIASLFPVAKKAHRLLIYKIQQQ